MMLDAMDLQAVIALDEERHFGRAAARLHVSQPALSKQVRRVEAKVGGPLFVRGYRDVRPTEAGRLLAARARQILADAGTALDESRRAVRGEAGVLRVGFGITTVFDLLPDVLLRFRRACPDVAVRLRDMSTSAQTAALVRGELDVGFVRLPVVEPGLSVRPVATDRLVAATPAAIPWRASRGLASLSAQPFVVCARASSPSYFDHVLSVCRAAGLAPRIVQETNELYTVLALVRAGIGVALVPAAVRGMRLPGVRYHELGLAAAEWQVGVARRREPGAPAVDRFVTLAARGRGSA